jgi:hypothetical protein
LAKAKIERAEMNADFTRERLEMHKQLLEAKQENQQILQQSQEFKDKLEIYQQQYTVRAFPTTHFVMSPPLTDLSTQELEKNVGDSSQNFGSFRKEMEKLGLKLRQVERDTQQWKARFEDSNDQGLVFSRNRSYGHTIADLIMIAQAKTRV